MITRRKSRYVLIRSSEPLDMNSKADFGSFRNCMKDFMGERAYVSASMQMARQTAANTFIIRVNRGTERDAMLATAFIKELNGRKLGLLTLRMSGSINALMTFQNQRDANGTLTKS